MIPGMREIPDPQAEMERLAAARKPFDVTAAARAELALQCPHVSVIPRGSVRIKVRAPPPRRGQVSRTPRCRPHVQ